MVTAFAVPESIHPTTGSPVAPGGTTSASSDVALAPRVHAAIARACHGDGAATASIARMLTDVQRLGGSALPDPLPLVPEIAAHARARAPFAPPERRALLLAAVSVDDRVDLLLRAADLSIDDLMGFAERGGLALVAGRFWFTDQRMRIWVHADADLRERTEAHRRLADVHARHGEPSTARWHRALSALQGEAAHASDLIADAERMLRHGDAERAHAIGREAASHAEGEDLDRARAIAGKAALAAGWTADAVSWFEALWGGPLMGEDPELFSSAVIASCMHRGTIPARAVRGSTVWATPQSTATAAATVAALCAERGEADRARRWAGIARGTAPDAATRVLVEASVAWCARLTRGARLPTAEGEHPWAVLSRALDAARSGDGPRALQLIGRDAVPASRGPWHDSPMARAYRAVMETLVLLWQGDVRGAESTLHDAEARLPVERPFAGISLTLRRRLALLRTGRLTPVTPLDDAARPERLRDDVLQERAMAAYLQGNDADADVDVRLAADACSAAAVFALPIIDETGAPLPDGALVEPADAVQARALRRRIRAVPAARWQQERHRIAAETAGIRSPLERGRVELSLGRRSADHADLGHARAHLHAAESLFTEAGAEGWQRLAADHLRTVHAACRAAAAPPTASIPFPATDDPLAACRATWAEQLTERELDVALHVAEGSTNREVASRLHVSVRTVEVHVGRVLRKFDLRSRGELIALAHRIR